mmetsp:Transcript_150521/g.273961  ORF Transcript_150521/g.273961 Transcript_150521/m.273961 type:complete len:442 (-) Transcript_150521:253-1578(-)
MYLQRFCGKPWSSLCIGRIPLISLPSRPFSHGRTDSSAPANGGGLGGGAAAVVGGIAFAGAGLWAVQDSLIDLIDDKLKARHFARLPEKIILLRHAESEGQVNRKIMATKADNKLDLSERGREQARAAGLKLKKLLGPDGRISAVLSPFERTQQTLCGVMETLGEDRVHQVHVDVRVRELEFANLQNASAEQAKKDNEEKLVVGRFFHRPPTGESQADVYDRCSDFWESFCSGYSIRTRFSSSHFQSISDRDRALLIVTHGLTVRLLLMRFFSWSVDTVETVYNPDNCNMWVLTKNHEMRRYDLLQSECDPPRVPAAARAIRIYPKGTTPDQMTADGGECYTVVDYLSVPAPRTSHKREALSKVVKGHVNLDPTRKPGAYEKALEQAVVLDPDKYEVDWWCGFKSTYAVRMRRNLGYGGYGYGSGLPIASGDRHAMEKQAS